MSATSTWLAGCGQGSPDGSPPSSDPTGGDDGDGAEGDPNTFVDPRDSQSYPLVTIGAQTWFARNLNYEVPSGGSYCYGEKPNNCEKYGHLYTFAAAKKACPEGSHLPSDDEWKTLEETLGMPAADLDTDGETAARGSDEGTQLKASGETGFDILMSGYGYRPDDPTGYDGIGQGAWLWTSTALPSGEVMRRNFYSNSPGIFRFSNPTASFAISVRCLVD